MHGEVAAVQLGGHRGDQERHVVGDDLDDRVLAPPTMFVEPGIVDADAGDAGASLGGEAPVGKGGAEQIVGGFAEYVPGWDVGVVAADEAGNDRRLLLAEPPFGGFDNLVDLIGLVNFGDARHRSPSLGIAL